MPLYVPYAIICRFVCKIWGELSSGKGVHLAFKALLEWCTRLGGAPHIFCKLFVVQILCCHHTPKRGRLKEHDIPNDFGVDENAIFGLISCV